MSVTLKENEIAFAKIRETAVIPTKKPEDAGYDLYANFEEDYFVIEPGKTRAVPTGIATAFSSKYYIQIEERSSMAKLGVKKSGGVFDSGYRGEYFIMTYNTNDKPFVISKIDGLNDIVVYYSTTNSSDARDESYAKCMPIVLKGVSDGLIDYVDSLKG